MGGLWHSSAMTPPDVSQFDPSILAQPVGVAALFALAIWAGLQLMRAWIAAQRDIEIARIAVQQTLADALRAQAAATGANAEVLHAMRQQVGALEIVIQRILQIQEGKS